MVPGVGRVQLPTVIGGLGPIIVLQDTLWSVSFDVVPVRVYWCISRWEVLRCVETQG